MARTARGTPQNVAVSADGITPLGSSTNPFKIELVNLAITNDASVGGDADVTGDATVGGTLDVTGEATFGAGVTATGDLAAAGGFRQALPAFTVTLAASQTAAATDFGGLAGAGGWVAPRAGSVTALSAMLDAAITGSTKTCTFRVYKNGSLLHSAYDLLFTTGGAETSLYVAVAKDAHVFAAGDVLQVVYTTTAISNTPLAWVSVEIEC